MGKKQMRQEGKLIKAETTRQDKWWQKGILTWRTQKTLQSATHQATHHSFGLRLVQPSECLLCTTCPCLTGHWVPAFLPDELIIITQPSTLNSNQMIGCRKPYGTLCLPFWSLSQFPINQDVTGSHKFGCMAPPCRTAGKSGLRSWLWGSGWWQLDRGWVFQAAWVQAISHLEIGRYQDAFFICHLIF